MTASRVNGCRRTLEWAGEHRMAGGRTNASCNIATTTSVCVSPSIAAPTTKLLSRDMTGVLLTSSTYGRPSSVRLRSPAGEHNDCASGQLQQPHGQRHAGQVVLDQYGVVFLACCVRRRHGKIRLFADQAHAYAGAAERRLQFFRVPPDVSLEGVSRPDSPGWGDSLHRRTRDVLADQVRCRSRRSRGGLRNEGRASPGTGRWRRLPGGRCRRR